MKLEDQKLSEMLGEEIICLKASIIRLKQLKLQLELANLNQNDEDWEPMTDIQVDRWIEEEIEKD